MSITLTDKINCSTILYRPIINIYNFIQHETVIANNEINKYI